MESWVKVGYKLGRINGKLEALERRKQKVESLMEILPFSFAANRIVLQDHFRYNEEIAEGGELP